MPAGASLIGMPVNLKFAVELRDIDACAGFFPRLKNQVE
jgi:hypothetical protein